jgi:integrase
MQLGKSVEIYLSGLELLGGEEHQEQAGIILKRFAVWMERPDPENKHQVQKLQDLTTQNVNEFLAFRKRQPGLKKGSQLSTFTLAKEARYLKAFLTYCFDDKRTFGLAAEAFPPTVPKIKKPDVIPRALERTGLSNVFAACTHARYPIIPGITPPEWWFSLQYLAYITSLRRKGLFSLPRPTELELDQRILKLPHTGDKGKADRRFPLTDMAVELIRFLPVHPGERMFVWASKTGKHDYRSFYAEYERMQRKAGIMGADQSRLHVLRKTSLTHMAEAGTQMATVQQHAGHTTVELTSKYYIGLLTAPRKAAVETLMVPKSLPRDKQKTLFD